MTTSSDDGVVVVPSEPVDVSRLIELPEGAAVERHGPQIVVTGAYLCLTDHTERSLR